MTRSLGLLTAVCVAWSAAPAAATLLVYEPFDYAPGVLDGTPVTGENLTGSWAGNAVPPGFELRAASPGLDYGSLLGAQPAAGGRLTQELGTTAGTLTAALDSDIGIAPDSALFFSALFTFSDAENGNHLANVSFLNDANGDVLSFGEATVGVRAIRVSAITVAAGGQVAVGEDQSFTNGQTLFLLGRYVNAAAPGADVLELVGYDTAEPGLLPASFDPDDPNAEFHFLLDGVTIDLEQISSIRFAIRGEANNFIDELRIGTAYGDVVPEPASALLLAGGLAALGLRPRRRRRAD